MRASDRNRRVFLKAMGGTGAALSLSEWSFIDRLPRVSGAEAALDSRRVQFGDDIEPLVRLLEETPREKVIEVFAREIQRGASYQEVLSALFLAGVRNVQPRPSVGFKFHAVLVVNSAHLASLASPEGERWLPIFWALDNFKSSQARDEREGDWTMSAVNESALPKPDRAREAFVQAMDNWDVEAADVAVTALARSASVNEIFELMAHYGCRDFRSIGHKAIYVANSFRTLHCIGWRHAEPVLRSLTYALLNHTGEPNPAKNDLLPDAAIRITQKQVQELGPGWNTGSVDHQATRSLLQTLRQASPEEAVQEASRLIQQGIHPQSILDAVFMSAGEMVMQQPGIVALHSSTSANALRYAYATASNAKTRQRILLQSAAFIPYFRQSMESRGKIAPRTIEKLWDVDAETRMDGGREIFATAGTNREKAASGAASYLAGGGRAEDLIRTARQLVFLKGNDSHDYKFSSAVLEDYYSISPEFRGSYLAASTYLLPTERDRDNGLVGRIREELGA